MSGEEKCPKCGAGVHYDDCGGCGAEGIWMICDECDWSTEAYEHACDQEDAQ